MEYYSLICLAAIGGLRADATHRFDFNLDLDIQFGASLMALLTNSWPRAEQNRDQGGMQGEKRKLEPQDTNSRGTPHDLNVR